MDDEIRERIRRIAQDTSDNPQRVGRIWDDAEAVLSWLDEAESPKPPANTIQTRIVVDVSPYADAVLRFTVAVEGWALDLLPGWERTIVAADVYTPTAAREVPGVAYRQREAS